MRQDGVKNGFDDDSCLIVNSIMADYPIKENKDLIKEGRGNMK